MLKMNYKSRFSKYISAKFGIQIFLFNMHDVPKIFAEWRFLDCGHILKNWLLTERKHDTS